MYACGNVTKKEKRNLKILVIYQYFCTPKGSWSTRFYEFSRRWQAEGHQITVITAPYEKTDIKARGLISVQKIEGIKVIVINSGDSNRLSVPLRAFYAILFSVLSSWLALLEKADVVLASSGPITVAIPALLVKWFKKVPMIFEVRDLWPDGAIELNKITNALIVKIALCFEKMVYKNSDLVVTCSTDMKERILDKYETIKSIVIPNACDLDTAKYVKGNKSNKPYFIYTGSLGFMDDLEYVLNGLSFFPKEKLKTFNVFIFGEGVEKESLEMFCHKNGLSNIFFKGLCSKMEINKWLRGAIAAFVMFKNYNILSTNSPNKMFDAFSAGVPIIQNTRGWIKDLVDNSLCGINVHPDKPEEIKTAVEHFLDDSLFRRKAGKNALNLAQNVFNRELLAKKYLNALDTLYAKTTA